jgi:GNAT superfamily N-acetyltransferase
VASTTLHVRRATATDRDAVCDLLRAQFAEHGIALPDHLVSAGLDGHFADASRGAVLVATDESTMVGFAILATTWTVEHGGRVAWLEELYVLPSMRNSGVGTALLARALQTAREIGCLAVDLEVDVQHARAESLYARAGFRRLPRTRWALSLQEKP